MSAKFITNNKENNLAFIDGQNLYMGTGSDFASSLYKTLSPAFYDSLGNFGVRRKIEYKKRKVSLGS